MNIESNDYVTSVQPATRSPVVKWFRRHKWFAVVVLLPTLLAVIYYGFIASDVYVSQSRFVIKSPRQRAASTSTLANLIQTTGLSGSTDQTNEILDYIRSRNALGDLQKQIDVRARFMSRDADFLSRFPSPIKSDTFEDLYKYYGNMVAASLDNETRAAVLEVHAFTPQDAYAINARLLDMSEQFVNNLNERSQRKAIAEAENRVREAEMRVRQARVAMGAFRNNQQIIDPAKQAAGVLEISNELIGERAALQAQLDLTMRVAPRNPSIPALRNRIAAMGRQIGAQNGRAVGTTSGIASKLGAYENLEVEQEFGTQMLTAASASLEQARNEAQNQQFYLERVVNPNTPDQPLLPNRLKKILTIAAASLCLYFVFWMLIVGILEHAPED